MRVRARACVRVSAYIKCKKRKREKRGIGRDNGAARSNLHDTKSALA